VAKPPPYPPKSSGRTMAGPKKKGLKHPSFAGSDTKPYNVGPMKPKAKPKGSGSAGIGETIAKPARKKVRSGSTSARIRNMEKKYSRRLMEK